MKTVSFLRVAAGIFLLGLAAPIQAQVPASPVPTAVDSTHKYENPSGHSTATGHTPFFQKKLVRASIVPAVLIGYGISTIHGHGFYSSSGPRLLPAPLSRV